MNIISALVLDVLTLNNKKVAAMALWPFIIYRDKATCQNQMVINHEKIHHRQQLELLLVFYYLWYFAEYWISMLKNGFNHQKAYRSVSFEKEAFAEQSNMKYLETRKFLGNWKYFNQEKNDRG